MVAAGTYSRKCRHAGRHDTIASADRMGPARDRWRLALGDGTSSDGSRWRPYPDRQSRHGKTRSEEHTSEIQSLMRISYAVFFLTKKNKTIYHLKTIYAY